MEKEDVVLENFDFCFACKKPLVSLKLGDCENLKVQIVLVCTNEKCPRVGLLTVAGLRYKEVKDEISEQGPNQQNEQKN